TLSLFPPSSPVTAAPMATSTTTTATTVPAVVPPASPLKNKNPFLDLPETAAPQKVPTISLSCVNPKSSSTDKPNTLSSPPRKPLPSSHGTHRPPPRPPRDPNHPRLP